MSNKGELLELVGLLSDYECTHLLSAVREIASGERFWEDDVGVFYNEYVKARYFNISRNLSNIVPAGPLADDGLFVPISIVKSYPGARRVSLPPPERVEVQLVDTLEQRRSRRNYGNASLSAVQLSTLLYCASGVTGMEKGYDYERLPLRAFPSSGGMQVPEIYLSIQSVTGIPAGLYHYHPFDHELELVKDGHHGAALRAIALGQPYVESAPVVMVITGYYQRLRWKYGERAYRYMCMDVGFLGENVYLAAEALSLGTCAIAGFVDDSIEELLGVNGRDEMVLLLMTVGICKVDGSCS